MAEQTLRDAAESADAERFVGRDAELLLVTDLLRTTPSRILFVHGPGGIGKSAFLRAAGRWAERAGHAVLRIDSRTLPTEFERAVEVLTDGDNRARCLVIDEVDALGSSLEPLRDRLIDALPASARLIFAGRRGPGPSWREKGLDSVVVTLPLRPLSDAEAADLLVARGIGAERVPGIVDWAQGSPLALTVAASTPAGHPEGGGAAELERRLTGWLAGQPMLDVPHDILEVAAIARTVDARLLTAALPGRATRGGLDRLAALPVTERVGDAVALHAVLAASIRARLRATSPGRESELVRRIAEHLATRARLGDMGALLRLSQLIETPELRDAIGNDPSDTYYADRPHHGELASFGHTNGFDQGPDWPEIVAWMEQPSAEITLIRRIEGHPVMFSAFVPVATLSPDGAIASSLLAAAHVSGADPLRSVAGVVMFANGSAQDVAESARLGSGAFMLQRGADMESMLIHYPAPDRRPSVPSAIASEVAAELARPVAISDFRPLGAIGTVEAMILGEHGFAPPAQEFAALLAEDDDPVRIERLRARLDDVFGSSDAERRLRRTIELVHLGIRTDEEECLAELHVSRRTWFRLLRTARERITAAR